MMSYKFYAVKDNVTGLFYVNHIPAVNKNDGIRQYLKIFANHEYKFDTSLYYVGMFNCETGVFDGGRCDFITTYQNAEDAMAVDSLEEVKDDE